MNPQDIKNKGQRRLFQSEYMELMTKTHPLVIFSLYVPILLFLLYYSYSYFYFSAIKVIALFLLGIFSWTLFEYLMHRFVFHYVSDNPRVQKIVYTIHGVHHEYPRDRERLFMPPIPSLIISSLLFFLMYGLMKEAVFAFFPGFLFGYLMYGSMHYAIHALTPPKHMRALWRSHQLHHYKYPNMGFGVSSIIWDYVFRTIPPKK